MQKEGEASDLSFLFLISYRSNTLICSYFSGISRI